MKKLISLIMLGSTITFSSGCARKERPRATVASQVEAPARFTGIQTKGPWVRVGEETSYDLTDSSVEVQKQNDSKGYLELRFDQAKLGHRFQFVLYSNSFFGQDHSYDVSVYEMTPGKTYTLDEGRKIQVSGVSGDGVACGEISKFDLTPLEVVVQDGSIVSFAANLVQGCGEGREYTAQIRFNSTVPFDLLVGAKN